MIRSEDGKVRRRVFNLSLHGKICAFAGSPRSDGSFWNLGVASPPPNESIPANVRLASLKAKQGAIINLFSSDGQTFEIQPWDGSASIKCYPKIKSINFAEGHWTDTVEFTVQMEADNVWWGAQDGGGGLGGLEPDETWAVEVANENLRTYRISHTVSSQQRATYDGAGNITAAGWQNAATVVAPFVGQAVPAGILPPLIDGTYQACNYVRSQQIDEANGRFSVTENWVYTPSFRYTEEFVVNARFQEGQSHVTVEGTITGFAPADPAQSIAFMQAAKYNNALTAWQTVVSPQLLTRAQNNAGISLNPTVLTDSVGFNPINGVITYNFEFDNRPSSLIAGALSEILTISDDNPNDVFATLTIPGRPSGPVLQAIGTVTAAQRSVSFEIVMPPWTYGNSMPAAPNVTAILLDFMPAGAFVAKDTNTWVPRTGSGGARYSRNITWTY